MSKKVFSILFILLFTVGVLFRWYALGALPRSLDWDEVSQGYNAYSLLHTGKDEYGISYPRTIRSFNDFKTPVYTYLTIPSVHFFGLTPFSERLPSALAGSVSILLVYGLVYELMRKEKHTQLISLFSMGFFAISPWAIHFSRTAFDANIAVCAALLGVWLFLRGINLQKVVYIFIATFILGGSVYIAHSEKIFAPLMLLCLIVWGRKYFVNKRVLLIIVLCLFGFLNLFWFFDKNTTTRSKGVLFTTSSLPKLQQVGLQMAEDQGKNDTVGIALHNRRLVYIQQYLQNYLSHFNLNYLFITGDTARHHVPESGVLYLISLPFILYGIYAVFAYRIHRVWIVFAWLFIAPIASGFAIDAPNFQRSLIFLPSWHIFEAIGWTYFITQQTQYKKLLQISKILMVLLLVGNMFYFLHQYTSHIDSEYGQYWQDGYKEAIDYASHTDKKVFFANDVEQAYSFYLFYTKYDPQKYLAKGGSNRKENPCYAIENTYYGACEERIKKGDILITGKAVNSDYRAVHTINYLSGRPALTIYEHQ